MLLMDIASLGGKTWRLLNLHTMQLVPALPEVNYGRQKSFSKEQKVRRQATSGNSTDILPDLCKYSEELSDDEKTAELLPISVQQLYILECLGKSDEAQAIASEIKADE